MPQNPYVDLPEKAFWRSAVAQTSPFEISHLWTPKFSFLPNHKVATAGSCFAQHIGRAFVAGGYNWFDAEPAPVGTPDDISKEFNYRVFSFRTGNIYTVEALRQWVFWALGNESPPEEYWETKGRWFDPFRPNIEPDGFASIDELVTSRQVTLDAIKRTVRESDRFIFTLGLTEGWRRRDARYVYAMCPGTLAGEFDERTHEFHNYTFDEIRDGLQATIERMKQENDKIRFLLTVSPVPLTATASPEHVLVATTYSKSTLRSVAGYFAQTRDDVDYFPSYEIITGAPFRSMFYEPNLRSVATDGVQFVMKSFFASFDAKSAPAVAADPPPVERGRAAPAQYEDDVVCEEQMLAAFGG